MATYTVDTYGEFEPYWRREWLLTNGIGSFAMGTTVGCNTRRYHGLLCAATLPPVGRVMTLNRVGEILRFGDGPDEARELSVNYFRGGNVHPRGDRYLRRFAFDDVARWDYEVEGVTVAKELQLLWKQNVAGVRYTIDPGGRAVRLDLLPFVSFRDFHALRRGRGEFDVRVEPRRAIVREHQTELFLHADAGAFVEARDWWFDHWYPTEADRGQDDLEDLFNPGRFTVEISGPTTVTLWASLAPLNELPDWKAELTSRGAPRGAATSPAKPPAARPSPIVERLMRAADDFIVFRKAPDGSDGTSVLAGYPWFADWGRDTFISLPGLLLVPGRYEQARQVLRVFGEYVSEGMIPNRFDDYTSEPSYNTVDASLWYVHAAHEYRRLSADEEGFKKWMLPACREIVAGYKRGTRFHIKMEADGLITQGDYSTQLTWMDAKSEGIAYTPRQGKPVEINALWYHVLTLMGETDLAATVAASFRRVFWISPWLGLADVVGEGGQDRSIRPNQIFAVSLPNSPLDADQQRAVVEVVRRELLTPVGLRTLSRADPKYRGRYTGPQPARDACYHNGTVWPWPIGAFLEAYLKVNNRSPEALDQARRWLRPLVEHMERDCVGQIAEIFEGDEPHRPVGCPAQAWSVAEVLRLAVDVGL